MVQYVDYTQDEAQHWFLLLAAPIRFPGSSNENALLGHCHVSNLVPVARGRGGGGGTWHKKFYKLCLAFHSKSLSPMPDHQEQAQNAKRL